MSLFRHLIGPRGVILRASKGHAFKLVEVPVDDKGSEIPEHRINDPLLLSKGRPRRNGVQI